MKKRIFNVTCLVAVLSLHVSVAFAAPDAKEVASQTVPTRVACVGDSITYGFAIENREKNSYPAKLAVALGDKWSVGNFGKNGATVLKKGHAPYWKAPQYKKAIQFLPDVVIIKFGTNDSRPMNWGKHKAEFVSDYVDLIRMFQNLKSKPTVWICYPVPVHPGPVTEKLSFSDRVIKDEVIPLVDEVAAKAGVKVIDLNSVLSKGELFTDGVHPNDVGAELMAKTIATEIAQKKVSE